MAFTEEATIVGDSGCASLCLPGKTRVRGLGLVKQNDARNPELDPKASLLRLAVRGRGSRGRGHEHDRTLPAALCVPGTWRCSRGRKTATP